MTEMETVTFGLAKDAADTINRRLVRKQGNEFPKDSTIQVETTREILEVEDAIPDNEEQIVDLYTDDGGHPYYPNEIKKIEQVN